MRRWTSPGGSASSTSTTARSRSWADRSSPDLQAELPGLVPPLDDVPTEAEMRVAQAQLVGWLEGLFHGIQAAMFAQQMAARQQFEEIRRRGLMA